MRFGSTAKVLLKCKLKYYRISECAWHSPAWLCCTHACICNAMRLAWDRHEATFIPHFILMPLRRLLAEPAESGTSRAGTAQPKQPRAMACKCRPQGPSQGALRRQSISRILPCQAQQILSSATCSNQCSKQGRLCRPCHGSRYRTVWAHLWSQTSRIRQTSSICTKMVQEPLLCQQSLPQ